MVLIDGHMHRVLEGLRDSGMEAVLQQTCDKPTRKTIGNRMVAAQNQVVQGGVSLPFTGFGGPGVGCGNPKIAFCCRIFLRGTPLRENGRDKPKENRAFGRRISDAAGDGLGNPKEANPVFQDQNAIAKLVALP